MAILAQFQETGTAETPREPRRTLRLEARGALENGGAAKVVVHNISQTGLLLESSTGLAIDERIGVELPHAGEAWARVVWASGNLYGCEFKNPIPSGALSAAQLRSAVAAPVEIGDDEPAAPGADHAPPAPFGDRLQMLRAARGLSLSEIAARLGVSKPTVWAWEHNKARPLDDRLDALAEALGVERSELVARPAGGMLDNVIARHRDAIAAAVGIAPEKVRIWIEL